MGFLGIECKQFQGSIREGNDYFVTGQGCNFLGNLKNQDAAQTKF